MTTVVFVVSKWSLHLDAEEKWTSKLALSKAIGVSDSNDCRLYIYVSVVRGDLRTQTWTYFR
jgi:hypothetical protein